ncbi:Beta-galactosidase 8 [Dinochytrium kinnereticum]|nr:Beta-galactosidase 8 [Dinochytrium kinnereticum]
MWQSLMKKSRVAGINVIDTYVFWNLHEKEEGLFDFETESRNISGFLKAAADEGLYVMLRIGPFVSKYLLLSYKSELTHASDAEHDFGGLPFWLLEKPNIELRTYNMDYMIAMERFIRKVVDVIQPYLIANGGPIILLQMENEYGSPEREYGLNGKKYINWAADLANSLNLGIPWVMCQQDNVPTVINTVNGYYGDAWIPAHYARFKDQPAMFTELWSGWYGRWGIAKPTRPAEDVAFAAARFVARGGTYVAYYMWHGGTNFGRQASSFVTTSYDYDAPLTEYGFENQPKYNHLRDFHLLCHEYSDMLLGFEPTYYSTGPSTEAHVYGKLGKTDRLLVFLSNFHEYGDKAVMMYGTEFFLPKWSVSVYVMSKDGLALRYRTSSPSPTSSLAITVGPEHSSLRIGVKVADISFIREPVPKGIEAGDMVANEPLEHYRTTRDTTDYLWYIRQNVTIPPPPKYPSLPGGYPRPLVRFTRLEDFGSVWVDDDRLVVREPSVMGMTDFEDSEKRIPTKPAPPFGHTVAVLVGVFGSKACCVHMERFEKGVLGRVFVGGEDVTKGVWAHRVGLLGERKMV